jgi:hypothetical protein
MTISGDPNPNAKCSSEDDDVEDDTYVPSPRVRPHGKGVAGPSGSGSRAARDEEIEEEIEEEEGGGNGNDGFEGDDDEEEEEEDEENFDVEINPSSYIHMGNPTFRLPLNPDWREKISYNGKTDLVRENRKENPILFEKEPNIDYRFHTVFQQNFYESMIITKIKHVAIS